MSKKIKSNIVIFIILTLVITLFQPCTVNAKNYRKYSSKVSGWGLSKNKEHKIPKGSYPYAGFSLSKYDACYHGSSKERNIYITVDCGYENGNTAEILDALKKYDVKAVFFVTKAFVNRAPRLIKRMKREGHLVGNHTAQHINLGTASPSRIRNELKTVEKLMKEKTGYTLDKYMRPPEGKYSARSLAVVKDMGYRTIFWSNAWVDWDENNQPSTAYVEDQMTTYSHNGMIVLLHNTSKADTKALPAAIRKLKKSGYFFGSVDDIFRKKPKLTVSVKNRAYNGKAITYKVTSNSKGKIKAQFFKGKKKLKKAPVDAGTYYLEVTLVKTNNYKERTKRVKFSIKKAKPVIKLKVKQEYLEGEQYEPVFDSNLTLKNVQYMYYNEAGEIIEKPTAAGSYAVKAHVSSTKNYYSTDSKMVKFNIITLENVEQ